MERPLSEEKEKQQKIEKLAAEVFRTVRDDIMMHFRFLDVALEQICPVPEHGTKRAFYQNGKLYYNPVWVLTEYQKEPERMTRLYLHVLLHAVFHHTFQYERLEQEEWDFAADIAVETTILEMRPEHAGLQQDPEAERKLAFLKKEAGGLSAEKLYRYFKREKINQEDRAVYRKLFYRDIHSGWKQQEQLIVTEEQWKKISERVRTDLKTFSKDKNQSVSLEENLEDSLRERYDYKELLRRFTVMGENLQLSEDEFDYIYYTYGLSVYGNLPLIEPLEYREAYKVKEFVIAIDTSASCRGSVVKGFLRKTYSILKDTENFFRKINVHIIQCDNTVQSDTKITCEEEFDRFLKYGKLQGFGSTDFRPVFTKVDEMRKSGEFEKLKGLIYFTDGYGIYPEEMPDYDVIFAFLNEDEHRMEPPSWAVSVILEDDMIEEETEDEY